MPLKLTRRVAAWEGAILGGNTVTQKLPIGLTYHQLWINYAFLQAGPAALSLANSVDNLRLTMNGKPVWELTSAQLDKMNQYQGRNAAGTVDGGLLVLDFDRYNLRTRSAEEFTSLGSGASGDPTPLTTLAVEMDLKAAVTGGTLESRSIVSESRPLGLFKKLRRFIDAFAGAGEWEIDDFPLRDLINAVYFYESANDIDRVKLQKNQFDMFDRTKELNARIQSDGVRVPLADLFVVDTTEDGNGSDQIITADANDFRFFLTIDGAMTVTSIVEYLGALEI